MGTGLCANRPTGAIEHSSPTQRRTLRAGRDHATPLVLLSNVLLSAPRGPAEFVRQHAPALRRAVRQAPGYTDERSAPRLASGRNGRRTFTDHGRTRPILLLAAAMCSSCFRRLLERSKANDFLWERFYYKGTLSLSRPLVPHTSRDAHHAVLCCALLCSAVPCDMSGRHSTRPIFFIP
jgi:hypothetical protein